MKGTPRGDVGVRDFPLRDRSIVCLSSIDWEFLWQGHQEIMARFAAAGNRVIFVENTGVRTVRLSDIGRLARRLRDSVADSIGSGRHPIEGVRLVAPLLMPFPRVGLARALNSRILLPRLADRIRGLGARDPVIFTFLPTPNALRLARLLRTVRSVVVYYCIADFPELSDLGPELAASEAALVREADLVFVQGPTFRTRFAGLNDDIHDFPFGVNLDVFDASPAREVPDELRQLPRPIIGYSGGMHRHVDFDLIGRLADAMPQGSVVLVGPVQSEPGGLRGSANVHFVGHRPFPDLPAFIAAFDVGLIPYVRSAYTDSVYPTKLFEYLSMGCPVVSTALPEVRNLGLPSSAVRIADEPGAFVAAVLEAVADQSDAARRQRATLAHAHDWRTIVREMATLIAERSR